MRQAEVSNRIEAQRPKYLRDCKESEDRLVGRNEAGKSNLLLALHSLNPPGGAVDLSPIKNFPRQRRLSECGDDTPVVSTVWELDAAEQAHLATIFPRAMRVSLVEVGRRYKAATKTVGFHDLKALAFSANEILARLRKITAVAEVEIEKLDAAAQAAPKEALKSLTAALSTTGGATTWAAAAGPGLAAFRKAMAASNTVLPDREDVLLSELEEVIVVTRNECGD